MPPSPIAHGRPRYEYVYAFTDRHGQLFTTVNVPYDLQLPQSPAVELQQNTYTEMLRPQYAWLEAPEAAFLTRSVPVTDALLSCVAADILEPECYAGGYRVPVSLQKSWMELESGLTAVTGALLQGLKSPALATAIKYPNWSKPSDWNFRGVHPHYQAAQYVARRTRMSLLFLAARCSMVIASWEHAPPLPRSAHSMTARPATTSPDPTAAWLAELERRCVPVSWRDAIRESIISDFSAGLRVGAVFQVGTYGWLDLIPVLRTSRVPVFFRWQSEEDAAFILKAYPYLSDLIPARLDRSMAMSLPPTRDKPPAYHLIRNGTARNHPDMTVVPHEIPRGPYQHPEESRQAFITRRKKLSVSLQQREDKQAAERRMQREQSAARDVLPRSRSAVYAWTSVGQAYPHYPEKWHALEIRVSVPARAVIGLWRSLSVSGRIYNSFFDEWDLWFSAPSNTASQDQAVPFALLTGSSISHLPDSIELRQSDPEHLPELESLPIVIDKINTPVFEPEDIELWYGVRPTSRLFGSVDYDTHLSDAHVILGRPIASMPQDPLILKSLSGWISAMTTNQLESSALAETWDLDARSHSFLPRTINIRQVRLHEHVRWEAGHEHASYEVTFHTDPKNMAWQLITGAAATVFLLRCAIVIDSQSAARTLVLSGVPFHTVTMCSAVPHPPPSSMLQGKLVVPYRPKSFIPTAHDYQSYVQRVLQIVRRPHAVAGLRMGGIVWRLLTEAVGDDEDLQNRLAQQAASGPSGESSSYGEVLRLSRSFAFMDDSLSEEELDAISGVYKVYTGKLSWSLQFPKLNIL